MKMPNCPVTDKTCNGQNIQIYSLAILLHQIQVNVWTGGQLKSCHCILVRLILQVIAALNCNTGWIQFTVSGWWQWLLWEKVRGVTTCARSVTEGLLVALHSQSTRMKQEKLLCCVSLAPSVIKEVEGPPVWKAHRLLKSLAKRKGCSWKWPWHSRRFCAPDVGWGGCAPCQLHGDPRDGSCPLLPGQRKGASGAPCACSEPWSSVPDKGKAWTLTCDAVAQRQRRAGLHWSELQHNTCSSKHVLTHRWLAYRN